MDTVKAEDCVIAARYAIDTIESFMIFALRFAVCVIVRKGRLWNNWERWCQWGVLFCGDEFVIDDDGRDSTRQIWNMRRRKKANVSKTTQQLWHHFSKTRFCDFLCLLLCSNLIAGHHFTVDHKRNVLTTKNSDGESKYVARSPAHYGNAWRWRKKRILLHTTHAV